VVDSKEIEPCPFCGSIATYLNEDGFDYVYCNSCGARGEYYDGHPKDAVDSWKNLRKR